MYGILQGGLGNQIFIAAAIWHRAKDLHIPCQFSPCTNYYMSGVTPRLSYRNSILKFLPRSVKHGTTYHEPEFTYQELPMGYDCYTGYFQSELYSPTLDPEFVAGLMAYRSQVQLPVHSSVITMHIRRGDYLQHSDIHPILPVEYYKEALALYQDNKILVRVISDQSLEEDKAFCSWIPNPVEYVKEFTSTLNQEERDIVDFYSLVESSHVIMANSSFSWWGARLCRHFHPNALIVAPCPWFGVRGPKTDTLYPDWMHRISAL